MIAIMVDLLRAIVALIGGILALVAIALVIGFWPLALLIGAGALLSLAKLGAGDRDW